jgi:uncharacterized protein
MMSEVHDQIQCALKDLSTDQGIRILYACESGSRAWGFASPDSDYDVRIIYLRPLDDYLRVHHHPEHIDKPITGDLDIAGWDIRKTLQLMGRSNAVVLEWLQSPTIYAGDRETRDYLWNTAVSCFQPRACIHHYLGTVRSSLQTIVDQKIRIKKYFYVLRPLLAALWIARTQSVPPMVFQSLLPLLDDSPVPRKIVDDLHHRKKSLDEKDVIDVIPELQSFIIETVDECQRLVKGIDKRTNDLGALDSVFRTLVKGHAIPG